MLDYDEKYVKHMYNEMINKISMYTIEVLKDHKVEDYIDREELNQIIDKILLEGTERNEEIRKIIKNENSKVLLRTIIRLIVIEKLFGEKRKIENNLESIKAENKLENGLLEEVMEDDTIEELILRLNQEKEVVKYYGDFL